MGDRSPAVRRMNHKQNGRRMPAVLLAACVLLGGGFLEQLLQLAAAIHLGHDVRAADEFAVDVELRDGRPVGVLLDALPDVGVFQHVDGEDLARATGAQDPDRVRGKTALGKVGRAFHVEHDPVSGNLLLYNILNTDGFYLYPSNLIRLYCSGCPHCASNAPAGRALDAREIAPGGDLPVTLPLQQLAAAHRLVMAVLQEEPAAALEMRARLPDEAAEAIQSIGAPYEGRARLEADITATQMRVVLGDVRGIGYDQIEAAAGERPQPVAFDEFDARAVARRIVARDGERGAGYVGRRHARPRPMLRDGHGDAAATRAQIEHAGGRVGGNALERDLHQ